LDVLFFNRQNSLPIFVLEKILEFLRRVNNSVLNSELRNQNLK